MSHSKSKSEITAIVDTREQAPLDLERWGLSTIRGTLTHGDYSLAIPDLRKYIAIERKSLGDFVQCCTTERERFKRELLALRGYRFRFVVCEFELSQVWNGEYRSKANPQAVVSSLSSFMSLDIPFIMAGNAEMAGYVVAKLLQFRAEETLEFASIAANIGVFS